MSRAFGVAVVVCTLTVVTSASTAQFAVNGVPVDGSVQEVPQGVTTIGIYITPDAPFDMFWVDFLATGQWVAPEPLPKIGAPLPGNHTALLDSGDVTMLGVWDNLDAVGYWDAYFDVWSIASIFDWGPLQSGPQIVAEFDVDLSDCPASTMLNLEFDWAEIGTYTGPVQFDVTYPLVLHVTPEPATLCLLALGGLAVLWRQRQGAMSLP